MADLTINLKVAGQEIVVGALRRVGEVAINALGVAAGKIADFAVDSFKGALEAQEGIDKLTASITRLGDNSPLTIDAAMGLADQFKNLVGGSDDMVLAMTNVGLRFDKINQATFPRFIEQAADLATTLKMEPTKAAELLGKVLQDLSTDGVGSIGRLKAAGIQLTDEQEKQIETLVKAGKVTEAQTILMDALAKTTGGAAAAQAETLAGKWAIFQETIADAGEGVALKLLPPLTALADRVLPVIMPLIEQAATALGNFVSQLASGDMSAITNLIPPEMLAAVQNLVSAFASSMPMIQTYVADMLAFVQGQFNSVSPQLVANVSAALSAIAEFWRAHGETIMAVVNFVWRTLVVVIGGALTLISGIVTATLQLINGDSAAAWETIKNTWTTFVQSTLDIVGVKLDEFLASWAGVWQQLQVIISLGITGAIANLQAFGQAFVDLGVGLMQALAGGILQGVADAIASATGAAQAIVDAIKRTLGISSPSKVFAGLGANMMSGMSQGIMAGSGMPVNAARAVSSSVVNSGGNTINYYGVQADMQYAYQRAVAGSF